MHFRSGAACPLVFRFPCGGGLTFGSFHSQELESFYLSMPGLSGIDVLTRVRRDEEELDRVSLPVIILSGRSSETERIVGLDLGADDYLVKPFSPGELAARARSVLRRSQPTPKRSARQGVVIDAGTRDVSIDGRAVELTAKEFDLLSYLAAEPGIVFRRNDILEHVWDTNWYGTTSAQSLARRQGAMYARKTLRWFGTRSLTRLRKMLKRRWITCKSSIAMLVST